MHLPSTLISHLLGVLRFITLSLHVAVNAEGEGENNCVCVFVYPLPIAALRGFSFLVLNPR